MWLLGRHNDLEIGRGIDRYLITIVLVAKDTLQ